MRSGEILRLKWNQVDFNVGLITVEKTKSSEVSKTPMREELTQTLKQIKLQFVSDSDYIFCKEGGHYLTTEVESREVPKTVIC